MKALDLNRLNVKAPYSVWEAGKQSYGFKTDFGVLFRIVFIDDQTIWDNGSYEFAILNENNKPSPNDGKVKNTIFAIIEEFFERNQDILLYQCETGDSRQAMRDRLFLRWFNEYERSENYIIKVSEIVAEGISHFVAIIVQKSNPSLQAILQDFDNFVGFFKIKPKWFISFRPLR